MDINIDKEKEEIIKKCIISNQRYNGNEELYSAFYDEVIKRGFIIFNSMNLNDESSKTYLNKIVAASIVHILEQKSKTVSEDTSAQEDESKEDVNTNEYADVKINYDFEYSEVLPVSTIKPEILQKIYDTIVIENSQDPSKEYLQIYNMRYVDKLSLNQIATKLNLDPVEVSKILFELMEKVRETLE